MSGSLYSYHGALPMVSVYSPFPETPSRNSSIGSLRIMQRNMTSTTSQAHVGLCCHCGRGHTYDTYYVWCLFCDLHICADCSGSHPATHQPYYKYLLDRRTARGSRPSPTPCTKCKHTSHCGLSCNDCEFNLCVNCITTSRDLLANHVHGKMTMTRAPDDFGLSQHSIQCDSCQAGTTLSHCGRCYNGIRKGQNFWTCVTCITEYNAQIRFCEDCQAPGLREHDPTHRFASFLYRVDVTKDPKYNTVKCLDCKAHVPFSGRELARHPHSRFQLGMGEAERDRRYFHSYRTCTRKPIREMSTVSAEAHDIICGCCNHKCPLNSKAFLCPTCTMITCETCAEFGGARSHPHVMIPMFLRWTVPPSVLGQGMVKSDSPVKGCARCDKSISPDNDTYIQCNHCEEWVLCQNCTKKTNMPVRHACRQAIEMTFFDPIKQANSTTIARIMMAQDANRVSHAVISPLQPATPLQPSFSIRRKAPSVRSSSSISSISPIASVAHQPQAPPSQIGISQLSATNPHLNQLAMGQQSVQFPPIGMTSSTISIQQGALPSIQSGVQQIAYGQEVRRKSLQPAIRSAYDKASNMVNDVDKETWKKMGKKVAAFGAAVGVQAAREYVKQETGVALPKMHANRKPNKQNHATNAPLQQDVQELDKLKQQLQLSQQILRLQNQAALQQQQQQQQQQNQGQADLPLGMANMTGINPDLLAQLSTMAHLTQALPSSQGIAASDIHSQAMLVAPSGNQAIPHASTANVMGVQSPLHSGVATIHPNAVNGAPNMQNFTSSGTAPILSNQANVASNVHNFDSNGIAPTPPSEMQFASNMHTANSGYITPIKLDESNGTPSTHEFHSSNIAPIPACEMSELSGASPSGSSVTPLPHSEPNRPPNGSPHLSHEMAPIPPSEQPDAAHTFDTSAGSSHLMPAHTNSQEASHLQPASSDSVQTSAHQTSTSTNQSGHTQQSPQLQQPGPLEHTHSLQNPTSQHSQTAQGHYEPPFVEEENTTDASTINPASSEGQHNNNHESSQTHVHGSVGTQHSNAMHGQPQFQAEQADSNLPAEGAVNYQGHQHPDPVPHGTAQESASNTHSTPTTNQPLPSDHHHHHQLPLHTSADPLSTNTPATTGQSYYNQQSLTNSPQQQQQHSQSNAQTPSMHNSDTTNQLHIENNQQSSPPTYGAPSLHSTAPNQNFQNSYAINQETQLHTQSNTYGQHYVNHQPIQSNTQPTSSNINNTIPGQHSNTAHQQAQPHASNVPSQHPSLGQNGGIPLFSTAGQADEYYQNHPLNSADMAGAPNVSKNSNHQYQQHQQSIPYAQTNAQSASGPSQQQAPFPSTVNAGFPTTATSSAQSPQPQINIHQHVGSTQGSTNPTASYNQAQAQQLNQQTQQIQALQQRLQAMKLQQQQQNQQLHSLAQTNQTNQSNPDTQNAIDQLQLQLLQNQLQQQQGANQNSILGSGVSILDNLTQNMGNNGNSFINILQQQQFLQQQQQQQQLLSAEYMNDLQLQNQLNTDIITMNDQTQANLQLEDLNAQLAALNSQSVDPMGMSGYDNTSLTEVDVNSVNVNIVDQTVDIQSFDVQSFDMQSTTDMGFSMTDTSVIVSDTNSVQDFESF